MVALTLDAPEPASSSPAELESERELWNEAEALEAVDGDESLLESVAEAFLSEYGRLLDEMKTAIDAQDFETLRRSAHTIRGSVRIFSCEPVSELAEEVESAAAQQQQIDYLQKHCRASIDYQRVFSKLKGTLREVMVRNEWLAFSRN